MRHERRSGKGCCDHLEKLYHPEEDGPTSRSPGRNRTQKAEAPEEAKTPKEEKNGVVDIQGGGLGPQTRSKEKTKNATRLTNKRWAPRKSSEHGVEACAP